MPNGWADTAPICGTMWNAVSEGIDEKMDNLEQRAVNKINNSSALFKAIARMNFTALEEKIIAEYATQGFDLHRATAAAIFQVSPADVTPEQRAAGKALNWARLMAITNKTTIERMVARALESPTGRMSASRPNMQDLRPANERLTEVL